MEKRKGKTGITDCRFEQFTSGKDDAGELFLDEHILCKVIYPALRSLALSRGRGSTANIVFVYVGDGFRVAVHLKPLRLGNRGRAGVRVSNFGPTSVFVCMSMYVVSSFGRDWPTTYACDCCTTSSYLWDGAWL